MAYLGNGVGRDGFGFARLKGELSSDLIFQRMGQLFNYGA